MNPDLRPQRGQHYEIGIRHQFTPSFQCNLTLYRAEIKDEIDLAVKFAEESPFPEPSEIYDDVYESGTIKDGKLCMR